MADICTRVRHGGFTLLELAVALAILALMFGYAFRSLSGALDRHPGLPIVIGHRGEALPFMLDRIDETTAATAKAHLKRSVRQMLTDQVWLTTSGFFTQVPFMAALMTWGVDRIMFSVDYPFASNARARAFLDGLPVSPADKQKIAHGNADRLLRVAS